MAKYYEILSNAGNFEIWQIKSQTQSATLAGKKIEGPNTVKLQNKNELLFFNFLSSWPVFFFIWQIN